MAEVAGTMRAFLPDSLSSRADLASSSRNWSDEDGVADLFQAGTLFPLFIETKAGRRVLLNMVVNMDVFITFF